MSYCQLRPGWPLWARSMPQRLRALLSASSIALLLSMPIAQAADTQSTLAQIDNARLLVETKHRAIIAKNLTLNDAEHQPFWDLYDDYMAAKRDADELMWQLVLRYAQAYNNETVDDKLADELMAESVRLMELELALRKQYQPRFRQVLPGTKVARFFQLDNKVDALMRMEMASKIPLVE